MDIRVGGGGPLDGRLPGAKTPAERLRQAAHEFEGVFVAQMFREMRATVASEDADPGAETYTAMLDDAMANEAARRSTRGLGEALYRQLARRLDGPSTDGTA